MEMSDRENTPFQVVLEALLDVNHPFPPRYLHRFSDMTSSNLEKTKKIWNHIPDERRRALLEDLEELAEADTIVSFEDLARFALNDPDSIVRMLSIRLLWEVNDKRLIPAFTRMMITDPDHQVRAAAANALGAYVYLGEVEELPETTLHEVEDSLLAVIGGDDHPVVQRNALESLGYSSRSEVPPLIEEAFQRGNLEWLASALFAMGRSVDQRWSAHVLAMLGHEQSVIREEAARAAGELELKKARIPLLRMAEHDEEPEVKMAAVWALSQIGGDQVLDALENLLDETEDEELAEFIENSLENLTFNEEMGLFGALDVEEDEFLEVDELDLDDEEIENPPHKQSSEPRRGRGDEPHRKTSKH